MAVTLNQEGYERRLTVVEQLLGKLGLQPSHISTLAFSEEYQYHYNNFLFKVELASPATSSTFPGTQPGTDKAQGVSALVVKLSNPAAGMNEVNRLDNDVAAQHLVRQSMAQAGLPQLVPAIYAWGRATTTDPADESGFGWTMAELMSGVDLDSVFPALGLEDKKQVLEQVAALLSVIQSTKLPESTKFGGLKFNPSGQIESGESPMRKGEPVSSYDELKGDILRGSLRKAAESSILQGWKRNGVDKRIEKLVNGGGLLEALSSVDLHRKSLIHGSFDMTNILFDKSTKKITAVLDFDWSYVSNPFDEFLFSLSDIGADLHREDNQFLAAFLSGDFTGAPAESDEWEVAKAWNTAMKKAGAVCPSDIEGVGIIRDFLRLEGLLYPSYCRGSKAEQLGDDKKAELQARAEADLVQWLEKYGF